MRRVFVVLVLFMAAFSLTGVVNAAPVTITFDEYVAYGTEPPYLSDEYEDMGIIFTQINPTNPDGTTYAGGTWSITGTNGGNFYGMNGPTRGIILDFSSDVTSVSFDYKKYSLTQYQTITYWVYNDGNQVGTGTFSAAANNTWRTFTFDDVPFDSIKLQMLNAGIGTQSRWAMDNLNYDITAVPIPASILLLGTGLVQLLRFRRK